MRVTTRLAGVLGILVLTLAACSGPGTTAAPSVAAPSVAPVVTTEPSVAPSAAPSVAPSAAAGEGTIVKVGESSLGQILVDADGKSLYLFTADTAGESTCYDDCAANWPPLLTEGDVSVEGDLDGTQFSTVERTDGTTQVKIGDWPLYYFAGDAAAGDTNGQGLGEKWYVVSPTGTAIQ